ncbi:site-specific integrase [Streptomyces sp. MCL20-2]|uniref:site-specific integrase n=1 Tax=Streptomyces sp. MCL20-2 TaxID=2967219 RepID=UPI0029673986|nr:site-specific integrase [Streptomyces sp. MCL20-2]
MWKGGPKERQRKQTLLLPAIYVAPLRWWRLKQADAREHAGEKRTDIGYVFMTRTIRPIEPRNLYRSFTRLAKNAGLRDVLLQDARPGTATFVAAGVPHRVVMNILGHSQIAMTMNMYTRNGRPSVTWIGCSGATPDRDRLLSSMSEVDVKDPQP